MTLLASLGVDLPVLAAPMAGGPTAPALVLAAAEAGSLGFLAGGYRTAADLGEQLAAVRAWTERYAVNVFAPNPVAVDPVAYAAYRERLLPLADRFGVELPARPCDDDDQWQEKVDLLLESPPPLVTFTFGLPEPTAAAALRKAGVLLGQTVTSAAEARLAEAAGLDVAVLQASVAGGHSGTFTPERALVETPPLEMSLPELVREVRAAVSLPVIAAGGLVDRAGVADALTAGADAVAVGTALMLAPEAGTSAAVRSALTGPDRGDPVLIRGFSGRPARGLRNEFVAAYDGHAPLGYPALHHLTTPIRRASAAAGDPEYVNVWAGSGYRSIAAAPTGEILAALAP